MGCILKLQLFDLVTCAKEAKMRRNRKNTTWVDVASCLFRGISCLIGALAIIMLSVLILLAFFYGLK